MGRGIARAGHVDGPVGGGGERVFVKTFFKPNENPIGHRFGAMGLDSSPSAYEIVGVTEETSYQDVRLNYHHPMFFLTAGAAVGYPGHAD